MSLENEVNGSHPPYRLITKALRAEIESGQYEVGQQLPTQESLVRRFGHSRATVQKALEELRQDGYIDSQQGRGSYVLDRTAMRSGDVRRMPPGMAGIVLADHIDAAFVARHVTLDTFSLTTESLHAAVQGPLQRIRSGEIQPESVTVRLLLPSLEVRLAVPRGVEDPSDPRVLDRLRELVRTHVRALSSSIEALADLGLVSDVSVQARTVPVTPLQKVYLINGTEVLSGYYQVLKRDVTIGGDSVEIYDFLGFGAMLFHHSKAGNDPDPYEVSYVEHSREWFDSLWSTIAEPLTLFE